MMDKLVFEKTRRLKKFSTVLMPLADDLGLRFI